MNQENKQTGSRYPLFEHMSNEYGLSLLDSQIDDITLIAAEINGIKSLREELEKLKADKESLLVRVEKVREINKQLKHEMLFVKRSNKDLEAENDRLKSSEALGIEMVENLALKAENQKLKNESEKLQRIIDDRTASRDLFLDDSFKKSDQLVEQQKQIEKLREALERIEDGEVGYRKIAKEALKGGHNE